MMGYIDKDENVVIPLQYFFAYGFHDGLAYTSKGKKISYIDKEGKEAFPFEFKLDVSENYSEGLLRVMSNDKYGFIDTKGNVVIPFLYESAGKFKEGLAAVKLNGKWGFIDKTGKEVIPFIYTKVDYYDRFYKGRCKVNLNGEKIIINTKGEKVPDCD
ncbi:WG repeat-containing protein [Capnocytophaga canimorsus]